MYMYEDYEPRYVRRYPPTKEEIKRKQELYKKLIDEGADYMQIADCMDSHEHYDKTGYGICEECGAIIYGSSAWYEMCV